MKFWAYKTQYCDDIVFAADIEADKVARKLVGRWTSPKFYSEGNPGRREVMFQRTNRGGNGGHFYYQSDDPDRQGDGARETLSHALCKRAISELKATTLRVGSREIPIRILESFSEKDVDIDENRYRPDVSFRFESDSEYLVKWGGILHVEVWHTHATGDKKAKDFFNAGLAMFEMRVTEKLQFNVAENVATKADMERHVEWLKGLFSEWIGGRMLSDPKSREYLLTENKNLLKLLDRVRMEKSSVELELEKAKVDISKVGEDLTAQRRTSVGHQATANKLKELVMQKDQELREMNTEKNGLTKANEAVAKSLFVWRLIGVTATLLLLTVLLLWLRFSP
ncbi:hypothetical protein NQS38_00625 [Ralstonia pseudosolanacearum]|uniref:hypothetical protein n=1 Tax=Ralstonia pseudosolanacearum TaxID=1310165 RepID=UPI0013C2D44F|nr:hypothetical protein [Ralstonia pseudosolanacearum]UYR06895.1 hypothetical protein NQS38_00625 [Ralstonia pseudosolanacearum]